MCDIQIYSLIKCVTFRFIVEVPAEGLIRKGFLKNRISDVKFISQNPEYRCRAPFIFRMGGTPSLFNPFAMV